MARRSTRCGHRITLQLDTRIALEALILNRMERIPKARRQEWLRGLLVQGFRAECRALRDVPGVPESSPASTFSGWLTKDSPRPVVVPEKSWLMTVEQDAVTDTRKPFAGLSKVIGRGS